jgi:hypothetical protein
MGYGRDAATAPGMAVGYGAAGYGAAPITPRWTPRDEVTALREEIRFHQEMLAQMQARLRNWTDGGVTHCP